MVNDLEKKIRRKLLKYLASEITLASFQDWLSNILWDVEEEDQSVQDLAYAIEHEIIEYEQDHLTKAEFLSNLRNLVELNGVNRRDLMNLYAMTIIGSSERIDLSLATTGWRASDAAERWAVGSSQSGVKVYYQLFCNAPQEDISLQVFDSDEIRTSIGRSRLLRAQRQSSAAVHETHL